MKIQKVSISNYRQLSNIELNFDDFMTVLAGPNNSGKTTLIRILECVFKTQGLNFTSADFPVNAANDWLTICMPLFKTYMFNYSKEDAVNKILETMFDKDENIVTQYSIPGFKVKIQIDYNSDDDIQLFSDYLMDLDEDQFSFYFLYAQQIDKGLFQEKLNLEFEQIKKKLLELNEENCVERENKTYIFKANLLELYCNCLKENYYFCNANYENLNLMQSSKFKDLFHFTKIRALRELDDGDLEESKGISKRVISLLKNDQDWQEKTKELPKNILDQISKSKAKETMQAASINSLDNTIQSIAKTSGGHIGKIQLELDVTIDDIEDFIQKITRAKYDLNGLLINESSQGLGFSNLVYLHLSLKEFCEFKDDLKVNLFVVEEPEAHMHPQMQNVFIQYLKSYYDENQIQGLITTHSTEIVRSVGLNCLRVLRQIDNSISKLFDMSKFKKTIQEKKAQDCSNVSLIEFYDWFFEIGFSEIIFADRVILYEGDTERLYLRSLINEKFYDLQSKYVAYVQVGGAYAINYKDILDCLKIKTLIITDLDFDKNVTSINDIEKADSTNCTINNLYKSEKNKKNNPTIKKLYAWQGASVVVTINSTICLAFQDKVSTSRTLEEAMMVKFFKFDTFKKHKRSEWIDFKNNSSLKFVVPRNKTGETDSDFTIRDIVLATSNSKTDFMYSVIMTKRVKDMLPEYIEKGLEWLMA